MRRILFSITLSRLSDGIWERNGRALPWAGVYRTVVNNCPGLCVHVGGFALHVLGRKASDA